MSEQPKKVGRRTFLNYAIAVVATGVIVGAATYLAAPKGEVTVTAPGITATAPGTTVTTTKTVTTAVTGTPAPSGKISVVQRFESPYMVPPDAVEMFKRETGIEVVNNDIPAPDTWLKARLALEQKTGEFDVVYVPLDFRLDFAPHLLPLDEFIIRDFGSVEAFLAPFLATCDRMDKMMIFDGKVKNVPFYVASWIVIYRQSMFEDPEERKKFKETYGYELEPPKSWNELINIAKFFTRPEKEMYGLIIPHNGPWAYIYPAVAYMGRHFVEGEYQITIEDPVYYKKALEFAKILQDLTYVHKVTPPNPVSYTSGPATEAYLGGRAFMIMGWISHIWLQAQNPETIQKIGKTGSWPLPIPGGDLGGWALGIADTCKNPEAAWKYIKYMALGRDAQLLRMKRCGTFSYVPLINEYALKEGFGAPGLLDNYRASIPAGKGWLDVRDWLTGPVEDLLSAKVTPEQFMENILAGMKERLKKS